MSNKLRNYITLEPVQIGATRLKKGQMFHARNTDYMCALLDNRIVQLLDFHPGNTFIGVKRNGYTPQSVTGLAAVDCTPAEGSE